MDKIYEITVFRCWTETAQKYGLREKQNKQHELAVARALSSEEPYQTAEKERSELSILTELRAADTLEICETGS